MPPSTETSQDSQGGGGGKRSTNLRSPLAVENDNFVEFETTCNMFKFNMGNKDERNNATYKAESEELILHLH